MAFGLTDHDFDLILAAIKERSEVETVFVFGSRALGNHKRGSDVDLAIKGDDVNLRTVSGLSARLNEELPLPYQFDVIDYSTINTPSLVEHIDSSGKIIYERKAARGNNQHD